MLWRRKNNFPMNENEEVQEIKSSSINIKFIDEIKGFDTSVKPRISLHLCRLILTDNTELQYKISNN